MADKLFEQHEKEKAVQEGAFKRYEEWMKGTGSEKATHNDATPRIENEHHGADTTSEGTNK